MRFWTPSFFHHSNRPGPLTNGLKYYRFLFRFRPDIPIFSKFRTESYCAESVSAQYHTVLSHVAFPYHFYRDSPKRFLTCFFII